MGKYIVMALCLISSNAMADYCIRDLHTGQIMYCHPPEKDK